MSRRIPLLSVMATLACSGGEPDARAQQFIFGGTPDAADSAVVAVVNFAGGQCSGALIAPRLVLTARHCVADTAGKELDVVCGQTAFNSPDSPGAIFVVPQASISNDPDDYRAVAAIRLPGNLGDDLCGTDVVLLRLAEPLAGVAPLEPRIEQPVTIGEPFAAVGYGLDESLTGQPSGERKRADELEVRCSGHGCRDTDVRDNEWVGSRGACRGDSGGPALDGQGRVIGVVSRGAPQCLSPIYGDVASRAEWLRSEARAAASDDGEQPPSWACDDGACKSREPTVDGGALETCSMGRHDASGFGAWSCYLAAALAVFRRQRMGLAKACGPRSETTAP